MVSTEQLQATMARYVALVDACDIPAIVALYAEDAQLEDPVGQAPIQGRAAIEAFYRQGLGNAQVRATLTGPVRVTQSGCAAMPFRIDMLWNGQPCSLQIIDVMEFDAQGLIRSMKAYWGPGNIGPQA